MTLPIKPEVTIIDDRLAVFIGGADKFVRRMQSELARLRRQQNRAGRAQRRPQL